MNERVKILFVDDEEGVLNALKRIFVDTDYTVMTATSGESAIKILEENDVQVIVSDYRMPGMNGIELLKIVRKQWNDIVRIILSGYADIGAVIAAINEGHIYKFISKPWNDEDFKITIANAIERYSILKRNKELTETLRERNEQLFMLNNKLKEFMEQQSAHLEFQKRELDINQHIINSLPVGIAYFDFKDMVFRCNPEWKSITGDQYTMPESIMRFIEKIKTTHMASEKLEVNGVYGKLSGVLINAGGNNGIALVFTRENDG